MEQITTAELMEFEEYLKLYPLPVVQQNYFNALLTSSLVNLFQSLQFLLIRMFGGKKAMPTPPKQALIKDYFLRFDLAPSKREKKEEKPIWQQIKDAFEGFGPVIRKKKKGRKA